MRLFKHKASKSSSMSRGESRSSRDSMFEPLENRQMFSVSPAAVVGISLEYATTFLEKDAYGANVGSLLGSPTSSIEAVPGVANADMQTFHDNGVIYWSQSTGAHVVYGAIGAEYAQLNHETDAYGKNFQLLLGLPTSDEGNISGVSGARTNNFQHGSIDWSSSTGAHLVYGDIGGLYQSIGGPTSYLGLPTSDESGPTNDRVCDYQSGSISWSPTGGAVVHETGVNVSTRYGNELVVTESGVRDSVFVSQSGSTLTITGDGKTFTDPVPAGGLFVYTRGGIDFSQINPGVSATTTIDSIDNAPSTDISFGSHVNIWADSTDIVIGGTDHMVSSFAGGVSKALGASLANPSDSGKTFKASGPLFGTGPVASDINQGAAGDCYFIASLAAFAQSHPSVIVDSVVDLGDGTYAVEFYKGNTPEYVRVNNSFPVGPFDGYDYAEPGPDGSMWGPVMEKAFCYFRSGKNTYASIGGGWMDEVYNDLHYGTVDTTPSSFSNSQLFSRLQNDLAHDVAVTMGTPGTPPDLVGDHCYTLIGLKVVKGVNEYIVRNPWGISGDKLENAEGVATLTYSQFVNNFSSGMVES